MKSRFDEIKTSKKISKIGIPIGKKEHGTDPENKRIEELKSAEHTTKMMVHWIFRILIILFVLFVISLFFFLLPMSQIELDETSRWIPMQRWTRAFLNSSGTAGIAILTVIATDLTKRGFDLLKRLVYPPNE